MVGKVSNIIMNKKFGFITGDNGQEYFFHCTDLTVDWDVLANKFLTEGGGKVKVSFEATKTPKGPRAKVVTILED